VLTAGAYRASSAAPTSWPSGHTSSRPWTAGRRQEPARTPCSAQGRADGPRAALDAPGGPPEPLRCREGWSSPYQGRWRRPGDRQEPARAPGGAATRADGPGGPQRRPGGRLDPLRRRGGLERPQRPHWTTQEGRQNHLTAVASLPGCWPALSTAGPKCQLSLSLVQIEEFKSAPCGRQSPICTFKTEGVATDPPHLLRRDRRTKAVRPATPGRLERPRPSCACAGPSHLAKLPLHQVLLHVAGQPSRPA
jgi:hypothetical protein